MSFHCIISESDSTWFISNSILGIRWQRKIPAKLVVALLLGSVHHDQQMGDWLTYEDGQFHHLFDNMNCKHHILGKSHSANLGQLLYPDGTRCML